MTQKSIVIAAASLMLAAITGASAEDFYKGKTITLAISAGPGGGYATYSLTMTKFMPKYIPGAPAFVRQHRQGAGGLVAANWLYSVAPRDGTVIATIHRGAVTTAPVFGVSAAKYDPRKFSWIGSINRDTSLCVSWHTTPVKTFEDAKKHELVVGGLGPGADTDIYPILFNNLFGTNFTIVTGYNRGTAILLAMERGEVTGRCGWSWSSINAVRGEWLRDKKMNLLVMSGLRRNPDVPASVPLSIDLAKSQREKDIMELVFAPQEMARPILAPPELPADRLKILREAFMKTMADPEFIEEAKKVKIDIDPVSGEEVEKLVASMMSKPKDVVEAAKAAIEPSPKIKISKLKVELATVSTKLEKVNKGGRQIVFAAENGKKHKASISSSKTKVIIAGKDAKRADLKPGMTCEVTYAGDDGQASQVACK
ncbi:MAG: hypothetical protein RLZ98_2198 [Pseudomonadota bacterium]|jgi:tripartite-type tricarboxylate transporter receptor subunit TctC